MRGTVFTRLVTSNHTRNPATTCFTCIGPSQLSAAATVPLSVPKPMEYGTVSEVLYAVAAGDDVGARTAVSHSCPGNSQQERDMPGKTAMRKAQREEIEHVREGKHGARSAKQAIAIGFSKARRAGVDLPPPGIEKVSPETRRKAVRDIEKGHHMAPRQTVNSKRKSASSRALRREGHRAASPAALSAQGRNAARSRTAADRSAAAKT